MGGEAVDRLQRFGMDPNLSSVLVTFKNVAVTQYETVIEVETETLEMATEWAQHLAAAIVYPQQFTLPVVENPDPLPSPLDVWARVGTWTKTIGQGTTTIGSLPGDPKGLIIWGSPLSGATVGGSAVDHAMFCMGFSHGGGDRCMGFISQDNVTTTSPYCYGMQKIFQLINPTTKALGESATAELPFFAASNTFNLQWSGTTTAAQGFYYVFGGSDIQQVRVMEFNQVSTLLGIEQISVGFRPDFGIILDPYNPWGSLPTPVGSAWGQATAQARYHVSVHASNTNTKTFTSCIMLRDAVAASTADNAFGFQTHATAAGNFLPAFVPSTITPNRIAEFKGWTSDGFKINWMNPPNETYSLMVGLFVKGGHWDAGNIIQPHPTNTVTKTLWHERSVPKAVMGFSINQAENLVGSGGISGSPGYVVGAQDSTGNKACISTYASSATSPTVTVTQMVSDKFMKHITGDPTAANSVLNAEAVISDMATTAQFTVNYTTTSVPNREVVWFSLSA